eukprot:8522145-Karenia_brevis.AAC.1
MEKQRGEILQILALMIGSAPRNGAPGLGVFADGASCYFWWRPLAFPDVSLLTSAPGRRNLVSARGSLES